MIEILLTFLASLLASAAFGYSLYRYYERKNRRLLFRCVMGSVTFLIILLVSFPTLWFVGGRLPAIDAREFAETSNYSLIVHGPGGVLNRVTVFVPPATPDFKDFAIELRAEKALGGQFQAGLLAPPKSVISVRTLNICQNTSGLAPLPNLTLACSGIQGQKFGTVRWVFTPHKASNIELTIKSDYLELAKYSAATYATMSREGQVDCVWHYLDGEGEKASYRGASEHLPMPRRRPMSCVPTKLNAENTIHVLGNNVIFDTAQGFVRFRIDVLTTLGVPRATYAWLAILGAVISGFLGSGWLWKVLAARWPQRVKGGV